MPSRNVACRLLIVRRVSGWQDLGLAPTDRMKLRRQMVAAAVKKDDSGSLSFVLGSESA